ncbi:MAG: cytochrome P450, partial [Myxococcales bacterium]|nr:cytochrome P450 [Myxococcales bacterium]
MSNMSPSSSFIERATPRRAPLPPLAPGLPVIGHALAILRDPLGVLTETMRSRDQVRWQVGPFRFIVVNHPDDVRHVLITNQRNYIKSRTYKPLSLVLGSGLVTSEGELWKRQRRLVQPAFHHRRLAEFADTMVACARDLVDAWEGVDQPIDAHEAMNALTFRIVGRTLFSTELAGEARAMGEALGVAIERVAEMAELLLYLPTWVPTRKNRRFNRARKTLDDVVLRMIAERRQEPGERGDLLDMLMAATDEE